MSRCQRLPLQRCLLGVLLAASWVLGGCDPKPASTPGTTPATSAAPHSGASPSGIKPADGGDKVDESATHKGPSEGGAAIGGVSGANGGAATGGTPAPSGGDGNAPAGGSSAPAAPSK